MPKYLVSVPILARMEITVEADNEQQAMEEACLIAGNQDKDLINHELIEPIEWDDTISLIEGKLIEFAISEGYHVWDYEKEFGIE